MRITICTVCPQDFTSFAHTHVVQRAQSLGLLDLVVSDIRRFAGGSFRHIDDSPYGDGTGMILRLAPMLDCMDAAGTGRRILLSLQADDMTAMRRTAFPGRTASSFSAAITRGWTPVSAHMLTRKYLWGILFSPAESLLPRSFATASSACCREWSTIQRRNPLRDRRVCRNTRSTHAPPNTRACACRRCSFPEMMPPLLPGGASSSCCFSSA